MTSDREGLPNASEIIEHGVTGLLVPPRDGPLRRRGKHRRGTFPAAEDRVCSRK